MNEMHMESEIGRVLRKHDVGEWDAERIDITADLMRVIKQQLTPHPTKIKEGPSLPKDKPRTEVDPARIPPGVRRADALQAQINAQLQFVEAKHGWDIGRLEGNIEAVIKRLMVLESHLGFRND